MTRPLDTSAAAYDHQIDAFGAMSPQERLRLAESMSSEVRMLALAGIHHRHPEFSPEELDAALFELVLGPELHPSEHGRRSAAR